MIFFAHKNMPLFLFAMLSWSSVTTALTLEEILGKKLYSDINLSVQRNQSCESCHSLSRIEVPTELASGSFKIKKQPALGFVDPDNVQHGTSVANGSVA